MFRYIDTSSKINKKKIMLGECQFISAESENEIIEPLTIEIINDNVVNRTFIDMFKSNSLVFHLILQCFIM